MAGASDFEEYQKTMDAQINIKYASKGVIVSYFQYLIKIGEKDVFFDTLEEFCNPIGSDEIYRVIGETKGTRIEMSDPRTKIILDVIPRIMDEKKNFPTVNLYEDWVDLNESPKESIVKYFEILKETMSEDIFYLAFFKYFDHILTAIYKDAGLPFKEVVHMNDPRFDTLLTSLKSFLRGDLEVIRPRVNYEEEMDYEEERDDFPMEKAIEDAGAATADDVPMEKDIGNKTNLLQERDYVITHRKPVKQEDRENVNMTNIASFVDSPAQMKAVEQIRPSKFATQEKPIEQQNTGFFSGMKRMFGW